MSAFLPSVEVCLMNGPLLLGKDVLTLKRGQWVHCQGAKGRIVNPETLDVLWRFAGESFKHFNLRFKRTLNIRRLKAQLNLHRRPRLRVVQFDAFPHLLDGSHACDPTFDVGCIDADRYIS